MDAFSDAASIAAVSTKKEPAKNGGIALFIRNFECYIRNALL